MKFVFCILTFLAFQSHAAEPFDVNRMDWLKEMQKTIIGTSCKGKLKECYNLSYAECEKKITQTFFKCSAAMRIPASFDPFDQGSYMAMSLAKCSVEGFEKANAVHRQKAPQCSAPGRVQ